MHSFLDALIEPLHNSFYRIVSFLPRMLIASILLLLFFTIATFARRATRRALVNSKHIPWAVQLLIARVIYLVTLLLGFIVALSAANIDVTSLIASLGIAGFALGFALKDILENFISGIMLLFARPFELDDQITVHGFEGTVISIEIRTTSLRTYNHEIVFIPNSMVFTNPVINHTRLGKRRYTTEFDTSLAADTEHVRKTVLDLLQQMPAVASEPEPFIRVADVDAGGDDVKWKAYFWGSALKASEIELTSDILTRIKTELYDLGLPTPTATSATIISRKAAA